MSKLCNDFLNSRATLKHLQRLHARIIITYGSSIPPSLLPVATNLISVSSLHGPTMDYARHLFDALPHRDPITWNALIRGYSVLGPCREAVLIYHDMHLSGLQPDNSTFPFLVRACAFLSALPEGGEVHCNMVKNGFGGDFYGQTALVTMYLQCGEVREAETVFGSMKVRNVVSWTAMIAGYAQNGFHSQALGVFRSMMVSGLRPNSITVVSVLPSCAYHGGLNSGEAVHGYAVKLGLDSYLNLVNALIAMYGKCGKLEVAVALFHGMKDRNLVSWNGMIAAYEQKGAYRKAIELFREMQCHQVRYNHVTIISMIMACAKLGDLQNGRWVHDLIRCEGYEVEESITNALMDMYAKCGCVDVVRQMFTNLRQRSVVSWSAMIAAYAIVGCGTDALRIFHQMKEEGVRPNSFTFTSILTACSRAGLVEEGMKQFNSMKRDYLISPTVEHCTCIVDLLGRAGKLIEAFEFIRRMPIKHDSGLWVSLLSACRLHGNVVLAEIVASHLFKLDFVNVTYYVLMSNIYAESGRWEDSWRLRKLMKEREVGKVHGHSLLEIDEETSFCIGF